MAEGGGSNGKPPPEKGLSFGGFKVCASPGCLHYITSDAAVRCTRAGSALLPTGTCADASMQRSAPAADALAWLHCFLTVVQGRAKPKLNVSEAEQARRREAITGFGSGGGITANGQPAAAGPRVIQKQQDSFVVGIGRTRDASSTAGDAATGGNGAVAAAGTAEAGPSRQGGGARAADGRQPGGRQRIPSFIPDRDDGTVGNVEDRFAVTSSHKLAHSNMPRTSPCSSCDRQAATSRDLRP